MKGRFLVMAAVGILLLTFGAMPAAAQDADEPVYTKHDGSDWENDGKWAFGLGLGMVNLDEEALSDDVEIYYMANARYRLGGSDSGWAGKKVRGYLEPELGYWSRSGNISASDLLLGLNFVGVIPMDAVDFFIGGGLGMHFLDVDVPVIATPLAATESFSDSALGFNAQFGVDIAISRKTSIFGVGRFDIVDDLSNSLEAKAYLGLRFST